MTKIQTQNDRNGNIGSNKIGTIEIEKDGISIRQTDNCEEYYRSIGTCNLQWWSKCNSAVKIMKLQSLSITKISYADDNPRDETRNS